MYVFLNFRCSKGKEINKSTKNYILILIWNGLLNLTDMMAYNHGLFCDLSAVRFSYECINLSRFEIILDFTVINWRKNIIGPSNLFPLENRNIVYS